MAKKIVFYSVSIMSLLIMPSLGFSATTGSIQNIGVLPGQLFSTANGVSGNGNSVVGSSYITDPDVDGVAFSWDQQSGMHSLGYLNGGNQSNALATNQDGSVIVGQAADGVTGLYAAFRWTAATGLQRITNLNPALISTARSVNADGSVVVGETGFTIIGFNYPRAFRWTNATGAIDLGVLPGGTNSSAYGVSADGNVVVGSSTYSVNIIISHAFRWSQGVMQDLGTLPGGDNALATAVSSDGSVVIGSSNQMLNGPINRAFRWTQASGMVDLGLLPQGSYSLGFAVNADGSVIVGRADTAAGDRGFRWTAATGLQTIEEWLASAGFSAGSFTTQTANSVNYDGSVIVGALSNNMAYVARVSALGSGLVAIPDLYTSLASTSSALTLASNSTGLVIHGSHGHPLDNRIYEGCNGFWLSGDWGYFRNKTPNDQRGPTGLAELGFSHLFNDYVQAGIGAGRTSSTQHLISNSRIVVNGTYFIAETMTKLPYDVWATLTGYYLFGKEKIQRGYILSGANNSAGNPSVTTPAARARVDWENAACFHQLALSPYADVSYVRVKLNAYTEHLGSFPTFFARRHDHSTEARVGINSSLGLGCLNLLGTLEGVHHFERTSTAANGQVLGLFAFNLPGQKVPQNWLRGSLGFKQPIMQGVFTVYLNGSTRGLDPRVWAAASYNISF